MCLVEHRLPPPKTVLLEVVVANCRTPRHRLETELIREEGDELNSSRASAVANERVIWRSPAKDAAGRLNLLCLLRAVAKRFPVPQDNFVPVAISSNGLVGFTTQIGSDGKLERDSEGLSAPLISGSGAIMPLPKVFVNYFVVLFT